ncbi:protein-glutamate O-methyltransferase CheR [Sporosarcina thermotolerans]|uniref:protein-glutamate O-methyltransferase n=1 Tax=Sporosarcina thermotolerans TaxID=633404 RepID=A0AAW9A752_9BACL|nr:protein-glutamate O-methyltransferase CheR [Sporosarcina thermotolerans]MDW0115558.1 protein-glutamate O-methyltransferase CheR [Sporosarcina thermotolerans]WHT49922.1 protein-glutamate O-methyltransferase CheR [Sporosarcina thermotolerans]
MSDYTNFIFHIKNKTGIDLSMYKEAQMKRRITSLYEKRGYSNFTEYYLAIHNDLQLLEEFLDRITINVSEFYRNSQRWEVLDKIILPELLSMNKNLKAWSAACSTGEEPYSLAMVLSSHLPLKDISILATDLDTSVLDKASVGLYTERSLKELSQKLLDRYFINQGQHYQVVDEIKRTVKFKQHNLLNDPYGYGFDLIICRNVMIYFTDKAKEQLYINFAKALKPGGILFVGSTEQIFTPSKYGLEPVETFFYKKK